MTTLIVYQSHAIVKHNGVNETLAETRSEFWIPKGRQTVKKIIANCVDCKKIEGKSYDSPEPAPLPGFRLSDDFAFSHIGIDYAGPLYIKNIYKSDGDMYKAYILLITCATSRAIHLELVPDQKAETLIRALIRFQSCRGIPNFVISDNGKSFKDGTLKKFIGHMGIRWKFIVERAPWWGGFYERLVRSVKRCLKKTLRNARLPYYLGTVI